MCTARSSTKSWKGGFPRERSLPEITSGFKFRLLTSCFLGGSYRTFEKQTIFEWQCGSVTCEHGFPYWLMTNSSWVLVLILLSDCGSKFILESVFRRWSFLAGIETLKHVLVQLVAKSIKPHGNHKQQTQDWPLLFRSSGISFGEGLGISVRMNDRRVAGIGDFGLDHVWHYTAYQSRLWQDNVSGNETLKMRWQSSSFRSEYRDQRNEDW